VSTERRRFYRIEDIVSMNADFVDEDQARKKIESFWNDQHRFSIRNDFNYQIEQHQGDLRTIKGKMPEVGRYLEFMQEQINRLTERLLADEDQFTHENHSVSLSAQGMSYHSNISANPGDIAEIHLKLSPSGQEIVSFARVVSCTPDGTKTDQYLLALEFEHIHDADREIIVKHVHGKQLTSISAAQISNEQ
jgi:hypothetical protein